MFTSATVTTTWSTSLVVTCFNIASLHNLIPHQFCLYFAFPSCHVLIIWAGFIPITSWLLLFRMPSTIVACKMRNNHFGAYKQPYNPWHLLWQKSCTCIQQLLNNLEPITSQQKGKMWPKAIITCLTCCTGTMTLSPCWLLCAGTRQFTPTPIDTHITAMVWWSLKWRWMFWLARPISCVLMFSTTVDEGKQLFVCWYYLYLRLYFNPPPPPTHTHAPLVYDCW